MYLNRVFFVKHFGSFVRLFFKRELGNGFSFIKKKLAEITWDIVDPFYLLSGKESVPAYFLLFSDNVALLLNYLKSKTPLFLFNGMEK